MPPHTMPGLPPLNYECSPLEEEKKVGVSLLINVDEDDDYGNGVG